MSSEVRRVPLDWKHPVKPDPYWEPGPRRRFGGQILPESRLHAPGERFVGLVDGYASSQAEWEQDGKDLEAREGHDWRFSIEWHLTGVDDCSCHPGERNVKHPCWGWTEDGMTEVVVPVSTEDELHAYELAKHADRKPDPADYMPVFDVPADELGWCLYETVSEGTPTTPVFATPEELIDHLTTIGKDYDQVPLRRTAAEALVRAGGSIGSAMTFGGRAYDSSRDADLIEASPR